MILPNNYIDKTCGVRPAPNHESFNNIIFSAWYHFIRDRQGKFNKHDLDGLLKHLHANDDGNGLYKPKNSHDNITYKLLLSKYFKLGMENDMGFFRAIKDIGIYRVWDVITYGATFGPKILRPFFRLFLIIPAVQSLVSIVTGKKIRPQLFEPKDSRHKSRFPWWYLPKKLEKTYDIHGGTVTVKEYRDHNGELQITRHMQNDGMHLGVFRIFVLQKDYWEFKLVGKIVKKILTKRYGNDYVYGIINRYFRDRNHPLINMWKGYGDIL